MSAPPTSRPGPSPASAETPSAGAILAGLASLATRTERTGERCGLLFEQLRKAQGSPRLPGLLAGLEVHLRRGGPVAARLLAAYLDMATQAERILPHLRSFSSSRRLLLRLAEDRRPPNPFARDWMQRLAAASERLDGLREPSGEAERAPGHEYPWPEVRSWLDSSLEELAGAPDGAGGTSRHIGDWLRLELDALEERASHLAGSVNPFRIAAVQRLLPLLSGLDSVIRDGRHWLGKWNEGCPGESLRDSSSRALERMEAGEFHALLRAIDDSGARRLGGLLRRRIATARPAAELADDILRLQILGQVLARRGLPDPWPDPLRAAEAALRCGGAQGVRIELEPELRDGIAALLLGDGQPDPELAGLELDSSTGRLLLPRRDRRAMRTDWPHGMPVVRDGRIDDSAIPDTEGSAAIAEPAGETGAAATRRLVVSSMQTMSILLALLRNPKVTSIPGLVAEVATRTRNPQVITTIATDRALYTGFANRDVPLACLWNPSNVPVKVLRRFIHVKYVSKLDLLRLSQDRAGVRRELRHEIDRYLATLA